MQAMSNKLKKNININSNFIYLSAVFLYLFTLSFLNFTIFYQFAAILVIFLSIIKCLLNLKFKYSSYFVFQIIIIIYIFMYIPLNITLNPSSTISSIRTICFNFLINISLFNLIESKKNLLIVLKMFIPIAIFSGLYIIIYSHGSGADGRLGHGIIRPFADLTQTYTSMEFASWSSYASAICLFFFLTEKKKLYLLPMIFYWVIILWAGSRKWLVFALLLHLAMVLFLGNKRSTYTKIKILFVSAIALIILFILVMNVPFLYESIGSRMINYLSGSDSSANARENMFSTALIYISHNPWIGYGFNTFRDVSIFKTWSESNFTELLFGGGIPLFLIYYCYDVFLMIYLIRRRHESNIFIFFATIVFLIFVTDFMSVTYQDRLTTFFISIGSLLTCNKKYSTLFLGVDSGGNIKW